MTHFAYGEFKAWFPAALGYVTGLLVFCTTICCCGGIRGRGYCLLFLGKFYRWILSKCCGREVGEPRDEEDEWQRLAKRSLELDKRDRALDRRDRAQDRRGRALARRGRIVNQEDRPQQRDRRPIAQKREQILQEERAKANCINRSPLPPWVPTGSTLSRPAPEPQQATSSGNVSANLQQQQTEIREAEASNLSDTSAFLTNDSQVHMMIPEGENSQVSAPSQIGAFDIEASTSSCPVFTTAYIPENAPPNVFKRTWDLFSKRAEGMVTWWKSSIVIQGELSINSHVSEELEEHVTKCICEEKNFTLQIGNARHFYYNDRRVHLYMCNEGDVPVVTEARWCKNKKGIIVRGVHLNGAQITAATKHTKTILRSIGPASQGCGDLDELYLPIKGVDVEKSLVHAVKTVVVDGFSIVLRSEASYIVPPQENASLKEVLWNPEQKTLSSRAKDLIIKTLSSVKMMKPLLKSQDCQAETAPESHSIEILQQHQLDMDTKSITDLDTKQKLHDIEHWNDLVQTEMLDCRKNVLHHLQQLPVSKIASRLITMTLASDREYWQRGLHDLDELMRSSPSSRIFSIRGGIKFLLGEMMSALQDFDLALQGLVHADRLDAGRLSATLLERAIVKCVLAEYSSAMQDIMTAAVINPNLNNVKEYRTCLEGILQEFCTDTNGLSRRWAINPDGALLRRMGYQNWLPNKQKLVPPRDWHPDLLTGDDWHPDLLTGDDWHPDLLTGDDWHPRVEEFSVYGLPGSARSRNYASSRIEEFMAQQVTQKFCYLTSGSTVTNAPMSAMSRTLWTEVSEWSGLDTLGDSEYLCRKAIISRGNGRFHDFRDKSREDDLLSIGDKIGEGGQAEIFEASVTWVGGRKMSRLVVKVLKKAFLPQVLQWYRYHSETVSQLGTSPGICTAIGATWLEGNRLGIVYPRFRGDLRRLMDQRMMENMNQAPPFDLATSVDISLQIAEAMDRLHRRDIVHRDLKAANILLDTDRSTPCFSMADFGCSLGDFKCSVADFGCSEGDFKCSVADFECSEAGVMGTAFWRAPEILKQLKESPSSRELNFNFKTDIYCYGMTCYEILTGKIPFEGVSGHEDDMVLSGIRPSLSFASDSTLKELIECCWHHDPGERPSFSIICEQLRSISRMFRHTTRNFQLTDTPANDTPAITPELR